MAKTQDSGYIIAGELCATSVLGEAFLMRIDSTGSLLWAKIYKEWEQIVPNEITKTAFYDVKATSDGGFIAVGEARNFFTGDVYMVKTDANGNSGCDNDSSFFPVINSVTLSDSNVTVQVGSGGIVGSYTATVSSTNTTDSTMCFDTIVGVRETGNRQQATGTLRVYPNPFAGTATVTCSLPAGTSEAELAITDLSGRIMQTYALRAPYKSFKITSAGLSKGFYVAHLNTAGKKLASTKIIVLP